MRNGKPLPKDSTANLGFEAKLWLTADKLRNNMDAAEPSGARQTARQGSPKGERGGANQYKHVVLGLNQALDLSILKEVAEGAEWNETAKGAAPLPEGQHRRVLATW